MNAETVLAYTAVAAAAVLSPGPAILLALRNSLEFGARSVVWSALGNVCGLFVLSAAAMAGLGLLLMSSAGLFAVVKVLGAFYLFYVGLKQILGDASSLASTASGSAEDRPPEAARLFGEALLLAITNPKAILFFSALFPQFLDVLAPLPAQFLLLTGILMALSFLALLGYAAVAGWARSLLVRPASARWLNRVVGSAFILFGAALLALQAPGCGGICRT